MQEKILEKDNMCSPHKKNYTSRYRIAFILPYFGKLPNYFNLWLSSCKYNSTIDWIIFTDDVTDYIYPENVKVHYITFNEIKRKIQSYFEFPISLNNPYKLCDYKVVYGEVFHDYLIEYDYWGYCDVDLIWGNIRGFITDDILESYDKILDSGHFSLYKNTYEMRTAYRNLHSSDCYGYKQVFSSKNSFAFDEWGNNKGINRILLSNGFSIFYKEIVFADIRIDTYGLRTTREKYANKEKIIEEKSKKNILYKYNDGKIVRYALDKNKLTTNEEMYIHFQKRPMKNFISTEGTHDNFMMIPPNKFIDNVKDIDVHYLRKNCKEKKLYFHYYRIRWDNLKKKIMEKIS